jgi:hypothetical protein
LRSLPTEEDMASLWRLRDGIVNAGGEWGRSRPGATHGSGQRASNIAKTRAQHTRTRGPATMPAAIRWSVDFSGLRTLVLLVSQPASSCPKRQRRGKTRLLTLLKLSLSWARASSWRTTRSTPPLRLDVRPCLPVLLHLLKDVSRSRSHCSSFPERRLG